MVHLGLIPAKYPYGPQEPYLDAELRALAPAFASIVVVPATPDVAERGYADVPGDVVRLPLFGRETIFRAVRATVRHPVRVLSTFFALFVSGTPPRVVAKNLAVFVKGLAVADVARERRLDHLHAYWLSTPATVAWIAARVAGIGFSATAHRWDVYENNMAARKVRDATFVRTISVRGRRDLLARSGGDPAKVRVVRLGVALAAAGPSTTVDVHPNGEPAVPPRAATLRILCAAALVPVKGHAVLLEALARLRDDGVPFACTLAGDGPLRAQIGARIDALGLDPHVHLAGSIPHDALLARLAAGEFDVAVIASIEREGGLMEGVPVALIEAMAAGVAVVATDSGSISELVDGQTGVLVPHSNAPALASALASLAAGPAELARLRQAGRACVEGSYDLRTTTAQLRALFGL